MCCSGLTMLMRSSNVKSSSAECFAIPAITGAESDVGDRAAVDMLFHKQAPCHEKRQLFPDFRAGLTVVQASSAAFCGEIPDAIPFFLSINLPAERHDGGRAC